MDDETKLLCLQLLETIEMVFNHSRPRSLPGEAQAEFQSERKILSRIEAIREKILAQKR